jgi:glutaredoxin
MPDNVVDRVVGEPGEPRGERCKAHNLAVGPGGLCVLCRQNARASQGRTLPGVILIAIGAVSVVAVALGLAKRLGAPPDRTGADALSQPPASRAMPTPAPTDPATPRPVAAQELPGAGSLTPASPGPSDEQARAQERNAAGGAPSNDGTRGRQAGPSEQDLRLALRRVNITMYATNWCPVCAEARQWLRQNDIRYTELDVDANAEAKRVYKALNPRGSVPTFDIDGAVHVGFSPEGMQDELRGAAEKRARQF